MQLTKIRLPSCLSLKWVTLNLCGKLLSQPSDHFFLLQGLLCVVFQRSQTQTNYWAGLWEILTLTKGFTLQERWGLESNCKGTTQLDGGGNTYYSSNYQYSSSKNLNSFCHVRDGNSSTKHYKSMQTEEPAESHILHLCIVLLFHSDWQEFFHLQ